MIENPIDWYLECGKYAIDNRYSNQFGLFFLIRDNAPDTIKNIYRKYLDLCIKPFLSLGLFRIKNNNIVDFEETKNPVELEQIELFKQLIKKGYIDNTVFPPRIIGLNNSH